MNCWLYSFLILCPFIQPITAIQPTTDTDVFYNGYLILFHKDKIRLGSGRSLSGYEGFAEKLHPDSKGLFSRSYFVNNADL